MEKQYIYRVSASATTPRSGIVVAEDIQPSIAFSAPPEFQGEPGHWTPEQFLLASVAGCFVSTFSGIANFSKFEFLSLELEAEGTIEKDEGGWCFTRVDLRPRLRIALAKDRERANRLLEKAEKTCLIARSLTSRIFLKPEIQELEEVLDRQKMENSFPVS
jgi:organic hydroperoxide reductase OsmC/OhrA